MLIIPKKINGFLAQMRVGPFAFRKVSPVFIFKYIIADIRTNQSLKNFLECPEGPNRLQFPISNPNILLEYDIHTITKLLLQSHLNGISTFQNFIQKFGARGETRGPEDFMKAIIIKIFTFHHVALVSVFHNQYLVEWQLELYLGYQFILSSNPPIFQVYKLSLS